MATGVEDGAAVAGRDVTPRVLEALAAEGHLDGAAWRRAREIAGFSPSTEAWQVFLARALGLGGALLVATAVVFFVAFNWQELGRFAKLALLEGAVAAAAIAALLARHRTAWSHPLWLAATLLAGALLAFIGQAYQTGADPWQLFAAWALLSLPWALAASWAPLWALVLAIANLGVGLFFGGRVGFGFFFSPSGVFIALVVFNAAAVAIAEFATLRGFPDRHRVMARIAGSITLCAATVGMLYFIFGGDGPGNPRQAVLAVAWVGTVAGAYAAWRIARRDLLLLSALALSGIVVVTGALGNALGRHADSFGLLIAAVIVGLSAWAAQWIRRLAQEEAVKEGA